MRVRPVGHRVLIKPDKVEETTKGGIILAPSLVNQEKNAQERGTVVAIGSSCWDTFGDGTPWCAVGQLVYYPKYSGMKVKETEDSDEFLVIVNDEDIVAVIEND